MVVHPHDQHGSLGGKRDVALHLAVGCPAVVIVPNCNERAHQLPSRDTHEKDSPWRDLASILAPEVGVMRRHLACGVASCIVASVITVAVIALIVR